MQGELNRAESQAMYSARLFCKQVMFFFKKTPLLKMLTIALLPLQPILHPGFPPLSATCQAIGNALHPNLQVVFPPVLAVALDEFLADPLNT